MKKVLELKQFDLDMLKSDAFIVLVGMPESGKTTMATYVLDEVRKRLPQGEFTFEMGIAGSLGAVNAMRGKLVDSFINHSDDIRRTVELIANFRQNAEAKYKRNQDCRSLLWLDDVTAQGDKLMTNKEMLWLVTNRRHAGAIILLCTHDTVFIPRRIRHLISNAFVFQPNTQDVVKDLNEKIFGHFSSPSELWATMTLYCVNHACLVTRTATVNPCLENCVYWLRAPWPLPEIRISADKWWALQDQARQDRKPVQDVLTRGYRVVASAKPGSRYDSLIGPVTEA